MDAEQRIAERKTRMAGINDELVERAWLREIADEITRLRADLARLSDRIDRKPE